VSKLADAKAPTEVDNAIKAVMLNGGDAGTQPSVPASKALTGAQSNPLRLSDADVKGLHAAALSRQGYVTKGCSTVDSLLPAQLDPAVPGKIQENRLLDYLPTRPISAPSLEVIVHSSSTGAPTPVAEGAAKPEVVLNTTSDTFTAIKLAAHVGISYDTLADFGAFQGYAQQELMRQIQDVENAQLLTGSGSGGNMTGFTHTSGVLTHDASTDTGTNVTALDSVELSIEALRTGSALAEANLLILYPSTFGAIRRLKNTLGNFLIGDPSVVGARQLFGVSVLLTSAQAAGTGILLDTNKFGFVAVREGLTVHTGQTNDDFTATSHDS
jgi:HK97 family phage major capsid protein